LHRPLSSCEGRQLYGRYQQCEPSAAGQPEVAGRGGLLLFATFESWSKLLVPLADRSSADPKLASARVASSWRLLGQAPALAA